MKFIRTVVLLALSMSVSCSEEEVTDKSNALSKFNSTWNIYEKFSVNEDGSITYKAIPWGGLVGTFLEKNGPVDLSEYESITLEFGEPTPVATQVVVDNRFKTWGKKGITSLTCHFDGQDVTSVREIVFQASDSCTVNIGKIHLNPADGTWEKTTVWEGNCSFGNWVKGFVIPAEKFAQATEGDKLEIIYTADKSKPEITYWLLKTIYNGSDSTLEGNDNELNEWGCAAVGRNATVYRIFLTVNDVVNLREKGLYMNGYYVNVTQVNLLCRTYPASEEEDY